MNIPKSLKRVRIGDDTCRILAQYPDYAISSRGIVFSKYHRKSWKELSHKRIKSNGYVIISLYTPEGVKSTFHMHQLVALAWIPNPDDKPFVGHKDNVRTHNDVSNLYWCTAQENTQQCIRDRRFYKPFTKASDEDIQQIRKQHSEGLTFYRLSKVWGYSQATIKKYCTR